MNSSWAIGGTLQTAASSAIDTANACHERGLKTIAVTAGYICPEPRRTFFEVMDAANVDLKGFTEHFYQHYTLSHLDPVLDTLRWLKHDSSVWFEITTLLIPGANDSPDNIRRMCEWIRSDLGDDVPLHFTAFHPDFRMMDTPPTPPETLIQARDIAMESGLKYVYVGNVLDPRRESTYCPQCGELLIERHWYDIGVYALEQDRCKYCNQPIAGHFANKPGHWGTRRVAVDPASLLHQLEGEH